MLKSTALSQTVVLPLDSSQARLETVGGKGANLARLARAGFPVPGAFLVSTGAYDAFVEANHLRAWILATVDAIEPDNPDALEAASQAIRERFQAGTIPPAVAGVLRDAYIRLGSPPVAVRSSATAEDLPDLSFAGQQDTYLNVVGPDSLLDAVVRCWGSLWTARAIGYRARNTIDHAGVALAVVVQEMVQSAWSGVLFTANPLNGRRTETVIDATLGLGEALVSGQVEPDHYVVENDSGRILAHHAGAKALAIRGKAGGGTITQQMEGAKQEALPATALQELVALGRRVTAEYGFPQDIEWAWVDGHLYLLQSRPITSLFPVPVGLAPDPLQVMFSFGAVQGILDPITPLGRDTLRTIFAGVARAFGLNRTLETQAILYEAGERLWANITPLLRNPIGRRLVRLVFPAVEPGSTQTLETLLSDPRLALDSTLPRPITAWRLARFCLPLVRRLVQSMLWPDAAREQLQAYLERTIRSFQARSAQAANLSEQIRLLEEIATVGLGTMAIPHLMSRVAAGILSLRLLYKLAEGLSRTHPDLDAQVALEVTRGLPHNVTTEMDLALWSVASVIRAHSPSAARFATGEAGQLAADYQAGRLSYPTQVAVAAFLERYGPRGLGEIDLGRARWREDPAPIMATLRSYLRIDPAQAPDTMFYRGQAVAAQAVDRLATAAHDQGGWWKAHQVRWLARRVRTLAGLRESPKFAIIRLMGIVRAGLLESGRDLVRAGVLAQPDDLFFLHLSEIKALAADDRRDWRRLVADRRQSYTREKRRRQIPRLLLSDGQAFYDGMGAGDAAQENTMVGSPVSPGVVEGTVHVVLDPHGAQLAPGEILVCPGTDPAWTPLFLAAGGLVMEVGGMMTHGSVVAREYGIPAVVGVHQATSRLQTGQRIRVNGSSGEITILDPA